MPNYFEKRFLIIVSGWISKASVPDTDESVIRAAGEDVGVKSVPCDVLDWRVMMQYLKDRQVFSILLSILLNIPNTDPLVTETRKQQVLWYLVPRKTIALPGVTDQFANVSIFHARQRNVSFTRSHCYYFRIGMAVAGSIDLSRLSNLLHYCYFVSFLLKVCFWFIFVWIVDFYFKQLRLFRICVTRGNDGIEWGMVFMIIDIWQPLKGVGGPI